MTFHKASKRRAKLRAAFFGPSGSGKTYTALRVATGIGGRIGLIDSEHCTACKYADHFAFDVLELSGRTIPDYIAAIQEAARAGYDVLVIDSLSHAWQELLAEVDKLAYTKFKGNTWSAWSEGTPKQKKLVNAILAYPGHLIATMRSKTEWAATDDGKGKTRPTRVGLAPEQGKGIEYEFDLLLEMSAEHFGTVIKDRTGQFQDMVIEKPGEEFGRDLAEWLGQGEECAPAEETEEAEAAADSPAKASELARFLAAISQAATEKDLETIGADIKRGGLSKTQKETLGKTWLAKAKEIESRSAA